MGQKNKNRASLSAQPQTQVGEQPVRKRVNSNHVMAAGTAVSALCAVVAVWISISTMNSQKSNDRGLKDLADSVKAIHDLQYAPQPTVDAPIEQIKIDPAHVLEAAKLTIRNIGRGTCLNLRARVIYTIASASKRPDGHVESKDWERVPVRPFSVLDRITLAAGESKPFLISHYPIYDTKNVQGFSGFIEMACLDENGVNHDFLQPFIITIHLEEKNPHAHLLRAVQNGGAGRPNLVALGW